MIEAERGRGGSGGRENERESFDAGWLALREPADHRARDDSLLRILNARWRLLGWTRVLDLGSGTGSNLRYLRSRLPTPQEWTLVDRDPLLLKHAATAGAGVRLTRIVGELADEGLAEITRAHLVTASALLDLVSESWLRDLSLACRSADCGVLFTLTYVGEISWTSEGGEAEEDPDPHDRLVRDAVNAHQRRDKGLGPALGPEAVAVAEELFHSVGYDTWSAPSPWRLGPEDAELVGALIRGWEEVASEQRPQEARDIRAWGERKRGRVRAAEFDLQVGHMDLLALPAMSTGTLVAAESSPMTAVTSDPDRTEYHRQGGTGELSDAEPLPDDRSDPVPKLSDRRRSGSEPR